MSFQTIVNNAAEISVLRRPVVAQTVSRSQIVKSVSRGNNTWRFEVTAPDGPRWTDYRETISAIEAIGRTTSFDIQFNDTGHNWMFDYLGDYSSTYPFAASWTQGNTSITITSTPSSPGSGYMFKAGHILQLSSTGLVYTVTADVAYNATTVNLHRPIIDATGSGTLQIGDDCVFRLRCVQFPNYRFFARDQIAWDGPFIFHEVISGY